VAKAVVLRLADQDPVEKVLLQPLPEPFCSAAHDEPIGVGGTIKDTAAVGHTCVGVVKLWSRKAFTRRGGPESLPIVRLSGQPEHSDVCKPLLTPLCLPSPICVAWLTAGADLLHLRAAGAGPRSFPAPGSGQAAGEQWAPACRGRLKVASHRPASSIGSQKKVTWWAGVGGSHQSRIAFA
jgi:hypothetical protein